MTNEEAKAKALADFGPNAYVTDYEDGRPRMFYVGGEVGITDKPSGPRYSIGTSSKCEGAGRLGSSIGDGDTWEEAFAAADRFANGVNVRLKLDEIDELLAEASRPARFELERARKELANR